jgi:hypothetical protein
MELVIVIAIVGALAAFVTIQSQAAGDSGWLEATKKSQVAIRTAILGDPARELASGYQSDLRRFPESIADLFVRPAGVPDFDPITKHGWRGPYLATSTGTYAIDVALPPPIGFTAEYGLPGQPALLDAWSNPIVLQIPDPDGSGGPPDAEEQKHARLVSAGPDEILSMPRTAYFPAVAECGDDIVLYLTVPDLRTTP